MSQGEGAREGERRKERKGCAPPFDSCIIAIVVRARRLCSARTGGFTRMYIRDSKTSSCDVDVLDTLRLGTNARVSADFEDTERELEGYRRPEGDRGRKLQYLHSLPCPPIQSASPNSTIRMNKLWQIRNKVIVSVMYYSALRYVLFSLLFREETRLRIVSLFDDVRFVKWDFRFIKRSINLINVCIS